MKTRRCDYCGRRRPLKRLEPTDVGVVTAVPPMHCRDLASCGRASSQSVIRSMRQCLDRHSRILPDGVMRWNERHEARACMQHHKENVASGGDLW